MYENEYEDTSQCCDAGTHESLLDGGERLLHLLYYGIGHGHGVGARAIHGVGLQTVPELGVPHLGHDPNRVALNELTHGGRIMQINAVAVVLHDAERVGVVHWHRHILLRFAATHHASHNYHSNHQSFHFPNAFLKYIPPLPV